MAGGLETLQRPPAMPLPPRRYERPEGHVHNQRMGDLTVALEAVDKPHILSAILRSCDVVRMPGAAQRASRLV